MSVGQVDSSKGDFSIYRNMLTVTAIVVGIAAQLAIAADMAGLGVACFIIAAACAVISIKPQAQAPILQTRSSPRLPFKARVILLVVSLAAGAGAFVFSSGNLYTIHGVILWIISIVCWWLVWSVRQQQKLSFVQGTRTSHAQFAPVVILGLILALGAGFRFINLYDNPREMNSDHTEKLLDITDVLNGTPHVFFERNTGREPWQFYWTVMLIKLFNLRPDFMALKIGTALISLIMLPGVFLLAREVFGLKTALIATLFAAVASWGVLAGRFGLRHGLNPCAVAWTMYFLVRGLRRSERNSMLAAGVCLGIGLQGYIPFRAMIVVYVIAIGVWVVWQYVHRQPHLARYALLNGALSLVMAVLVFMPLLRYITENLDQFLYRAATRVTSLETPIEGNIADIFIDNVKNVVLSFNYTKDEVWVANLVDKPAMDEVLGGLLVIGAAGVIALSIKKRDPWPVVMLSAGFIMLLPSAIAIAFPHENPSVLRTGGAIPLLMCVCAYIPGSLLDDRKWVLPGGALVAVVCVAVVGLNISRVFVEYPASYCPRSQNASDIGNEMNAWISSGHNRNNAYVVGYPYWVDSRAVGVWIGDINFSNTVGAGIGAIDAAAVDLHEQPGWFALNEDDKESVSRLQARYPDGIAQVITGSLCSEKHFVVFTTFVGK